MLCFCNIITDNDLYKLFLTDLVCFKHKHRGLHVPPQGVKLGISVEAVTEDSSMLGLICPDDILTL